jgi:hypothetical protein
VKEQPANTGLAGRDKAGWGKIEIKCIENSTNRKVELSVLCDAEVALIVSPAVAASEYANHRLSQLLINYKIMYYMLYFILFYFKIGYEHYHSLR